MNTPRTYAKSPELEAAVIADPERDLPRLVYADWLDEHDDPHRAAFIRAQCALWDKNPADEDYPDWVEAQTESKSCLRDRFDLEPDCPDAGFFFGHASESAGLEDGPECGFHRGFPSFVRPSSGGEDETALGRFTASLPELFRRTPIRGIRLYHTLWAASRLLFSSPDVRGLSAIDADTTTTSDNSHPPIQSLVGSAALPSLCWLRLSTISTQADARALASADLPSLVRFEPTGLARASAVLIDELVSAAWFGQVRRFESVFGDEGAARVAVKALARQASLHTLVTRPTDALFSVLPSSGPFRALGRLQLRKGAAGNRNWSLLARASFPNLVVFQSQAEMTDDDFMGLATADWLARLRVLSLAGPLGDRSVEAMAALPIADSLSNLEFTDARFGSKSWRTIATRFPRLTGLAVRGGGPDDLPSDIARDFVETFSATGLRRLSLKPCRIDDSVAAALSKNAMFASLRVLELEDTRLGAKGIKAILTSPHLQNLRSLDLTTSEKNRKRMMAAAGDILKDPGVMPHLVGWR